ncbi:ATP11 protein-domain-containing protein [Lyophyllum atratum]|nr:ATP11 protein-domain-containing protein [Lyophyllum atratum]
MHRSILKKVCGSSLRPPLRPSSVGLRSIATSADYESKYANKLRQRAEEKGLNVDELKVKVKEEQAVETRRKRELKAALAAEATANAPATSAISEKQPMRPPSTSCARKDSSPVKPLSSILNLPKIMETPHTPAQIGALWTAYHASRSGGTGRGYVCASIPLDLYNRMAGIGERYPSFIVPVPRVRSATETKAEGEEDTAYEFYFLQWDFHDVPAVPTVTEDIFAAKLPTSFSAGVNPKTSTVLFTPLQEYKMRAAFATPYIVLTHYTDLAHSHGVVLLRGEITPATASSGGSGDARYMMSQEDAQLLAMTAQKFYLWDGDGQASEGGRLLRCFHETPEDFKWEELLKQAKWTI